MTVYARISARRGNTVRLNVAFNRGGTPTDPYAIRSVDIYKTSVAPHNRVARFVIPHPIEVTYPSPITKLAQAGQFLLDWNIPSDAASPDVYFDVWSFIPSNPCDLDEFADSCVVGTASTDLYYPDLDAGELSDLVVQVCNRFWVYPDGWQGTDNLSTIRFGFEPLDQKFRQPEVRPLEVGLMPLPLYDYDYNLVAPIIPMLRATINIETVHRELLVDAAPMEIGVRQGSYRSNPFVLRYNVDTSKFLRGTYKYRITMALPDGTTRTSPDYILVIL